MTTSGIIIVLIGILLALIALALGIWIYILPSIIAFQRNHKYKWPIAAINILLGWSVFAWVGSLVWAIMPNND